MNEHVENHWGFIGFSTEKRLTDEETLAEGRRLFGQLKLAASPKQVTDYDRELTKFLVLHNLELSPEETKEREALFAKWKTSEEEEPSFLVHYEKSGEEAWKIDKKLRSIVHQGAAAICRELGNMRKNKEIVLPGNPDTAYNELIRLGMPPEGTGFSKKTFQNC